MTLEGVLFVAVGVVTAMLWGISYVLVTATLRGPRITALTVMAVLVPLITLGLTDYIVAVLNAAAGYPIAKEAAQVIFRLILLGIGGWAIWFWFLYRTDRFRDGL
jgi:hypothetical protein